MILEEKRSQKYIWVIPLLIFLGSLVVLSFVSYSDGDDSYFYQYCTTMGFGEYLSWRYETWTGRMIAEGLMHIFFNLDLWAWRVVNAAMLAVLPLLLAVLPKKVSGKGNVLLGTVVGACFLLLLDVQALGYSCIWITGSMNYLWPDVCGLVALCAVAEVFGQGMEVGEKQTSWIKMLAYPAAIVAAMSSEQMGAVLLAFEVLCMLALRYKKKLVPNSLAVLTIVTILAFVISYLAPGNELRVATAIEVNMPQFPDLTFGQRGFILGQWLVSSFANENAAFLMVIWIGAILLLWEKGEKASRYMIWPAIGVVAVLASKLGLIAISDIGLDLPAMSGIVEEVPTADMLTGTQWLAMAGWGIAIVATFFLLWKVTDQNWVVLFTYLGAIACEAVMILSPTIYSSGERVFFLTGMMLMLIILVLLEQLVEKGRGLLYVILILALSFGNFVVQIPDLLVTMLG